MLVSMSEENFEVMEADMLIVNTMKVSRYIGTFEKEVYEWIRVLGLVSDVTSTLATIQDTWRYLEPLYMQSEEGMFV